MAITCQDLPGELLCACFSFLAVGTANRDISNLRLVSKRFHAISSPFLITHIGVHLSKQSFSHLECLAAHPIYSKSIISITFNVSYYDKVLAEDFQRFAMHNASELSSLLEILERRNVWEHVQELASVPQHWQEAGRSDFDKTTAQARQIILFTAYDEYSRLYDDQVATLAGGAWASRLIHALQKLPALKTFIIKDSSRGPEVKRSIVRYWESLVSDEGLLNHCLSTSRWKGSFRTAIDTEPPVRIIPEFFETLAKTEVRPRRFEISVTAPFDLRLIRMSAQTLSAIRQSLERAENLFFSAENWARRGSLAENNDRPLDEMSTLGALTAAYFSSSHVMELHFSLDDYPCFHEIPTISLADLMVLPVPFSNTLQKLYFRNIPMTINDLHAFVESVKTTLVWLNLSSPYLLTSSGGSWELALEILRRLTVLAHFEMRHPRGGEFGDDYDSLYMDQEKCRQFVLRKSGRNPFQDLRGGTND